MKIALISDIHEDVSSLEKAFRIIEKNKCDEIICLGDIVGFCSMFYSYNKINNASKCVQLVKKNCKIVVTGNHDLNAINKVPIYDANFNYPSNWCELNLAEKRVISKERVWDYCYDEKSNISDLDIEYLDSLTEFEISEYDNKRIMFSHFAYPDLSGSTRKRPQAVSKLNNHFNFMTENNCNLSFSGHGHYIAMLLAQENKMRIKNFGHYRLNDEKQWIAIPCVAGSGQGNGFVIFDTKNNDIEIIKL